MSTEQQTQTQVIGFTASPAAGKTFSDINQKFNKLLNILQVCTDHIITITDDNEEIRREVPKAKSQIYIVNEMALII